MNRSLPDPRQAGVFRFTRRSWQADTGEVELAYAFDDGPELVERILFPVSAEPLTAEREAAFERALELLHLLAGVSYWKAGLAARIECDPSAPDAALAAFVAETWTQGLAEFAYRNDLDLAGRVRIEAGPERTSPIEPIALADRALVAMGGGKDSLVCLELLRQGGVSVLPFTVGNSSLIRDTVAAAGLPLLEIRRDLAPELAEMNRAGAWNGHVPITAINSAIGLCAALLHDARWVVFANERSAEEATLFDAEGRPVNHQYSKSLAFERALRALVESHIAPGLEYCSLLRPLGELGVTRRFAELTQYHAVFSSCNRNFHRDGPRIAGRWCGDCPKCRFTSLALAPFMAPSDVSAILGAQLLDDPAQLPGYRELCGLAADKPFECVGTIAECRAAMAALVTSPGWADFAVVRALAGEVADAPALGHLLAADGPHCIPPGLLDRVAF